MARCGPRACRKSISDREEPARLKVGIVGVGALGTLFGATLAREATVTVLTRTEDAARAIRMRGGLQTEGEALVPVSASANPAAVRDSDTVLVTVKAFDTVAALGSLRGLLRATVPVVSLQNGLEAAGHVAQALGEGTPIVLGPTTEAALLLETGFVRRTGVGRTTLGWADGYEGRPSLETFACLLGRCGLAASVARPIEPFVWAKAIVNAAVNPLSALARVRNGVLLERPELAERLFAIAREGAAVAAAAGITLPFDDVTSHVAGVVRATAENRSSMLQDLDRGRRTEIEEIDGAIVRAAERLHVAVPETTRALHEVRARANA